MGNCVNAKEIMLSKDVHGCYEAVACQCCDSGIKTRHRCRLPALGSKVQDPEIGPICGLAFCCKCQSSWGSEDQTKCCHPLCGNKKENGSTAEGVSTPRAELAVDSGDSTESEDEQTRVEGVFAVNPPDYVMIYMMIEAIGGVVPVDKENSVGFKLMRRRSDAALSNHMHRFK